MAGETAQLIVAVKHRKTPKERLPPISPCVAAATDIDIGEGFLALSSSRGRPFKMTVREFRLAQAVIGKAGTKVAELCAESGITCQTLYRHVDPTGALRPEGEKFVTAHLGSHGGWRVALRFWVLRCKIMVDWFMRALVQSGCGA